MTVVKYGEWPELTFALGLSVHAFLLARGLRGDGPRAAVSGRTR